MVAQIQEVNLPQLNLALPTYYILATAEASANLARFDGVRFGRRAAADTLQQLYEDSREQGFGAEVQRRILLGTYGLSSGYNIAMYQRAQAVRQVLATGFASAFNDVDLIVTPSSPCVAFPLGERAGDPVRMYASDSFTVPASLAWVNHSGLHQFHLFHDQHEIRSLVTMDEEYLCEEGAEHCPILIRYKDRTDCAAGSEPDSTGAVCGCKAGFKRATGKDSGTGAECYRHCQLHPNHSAIRDNAPGLLQHTAADVAQRPLSPFVTN